MQEIQSSWNDPDKEIKTQAMNKVKLEFEQQILDYDSPKKVDTSEGIDEYPDLTVNDIKAIFDNSKRAKKGTGIGRNLTLKVVSEMEELPNIKNNDKNAALFDSLKEDLRNSLEKSDLTNADRKQLVDAFHNGYLGNKVTNKKTREQEARWFSLNSSNIDLDKLDAKRDKYIKEAYMRMEEDARALSAFSSTSIEGNPLPLTDV
jgi:hypothetical protein